jgi:hypothetical protein
MALTLDQGAKLKVDTSFISRVDMAMMRAATTVAGEAQGVQSSTKWAKRLQLANRVIMSPSSQLNTFVEMVASDPGLSLTWYAPINISSSTSANPSVITTAAVHGYSSGDIVEILNHAVNTNANGTWAITVLSTTTFSIPQPGNGVGTASGTIQKMETDVNINFTISNQWNALSGVAAGE